MAETLVEPSVGGAFSKFGILRDQASLFVPGAYYQISGDAAIQLDSANDWVATKIVPEREYALSSFSRRVKAVVTEGTGTLCVYSHDATNNQPGTLLATLGTLGSGDSANTWTRLAIATAYQQYAGKTIWILEKGADGADYSLSTRRWNTTQGSMFPDSMLESKITTDGGSSWTALEQDSKPALWNIILNSLATTHVPQLGFGRNGGKYVVLPGERIEEVNPAGVFLDCHSLTVDIPYYTYLYYVGGELTLFPSTTGWIVDSDGFRVMTGATDRKLAGIIYPQDVLGAGDQAPVDVIDQRFVAYPNRDVVFGKLNPYASLTYSGPSAGDTWTIIGAFVAQGIFMGNEILAMEFSTNINYASGDYTRISFGIDETAPSLFAPVIMTALNTVPEHVFLHAKLTEGLHEIRAIVETSQAATQACVLYNDSYTRRSLMLGNVRHNG